MNYEDDIDADTLFANIPDYQKQKLITANESVVHEYKPSLRYDIHKKGADPSKKENQYTQDMWLKTIVAFLNSRGGNLIIGIGDNKKILGLEHDSFKNNDECYKFITYKIIGIDIPPQELQFVLQPTR